MASDGYLTRYIFIEYVIPMTLRLRNSLECVFTRHQPIEKSVMFPLISLLRANKPREMLRSTSLYTKYGYDPDLHPIAPNRVIHLYTNAVKCLFSVAVEHAVTK